MCHVSEMLIICCIWEVASASTVELNLITSFMVGCLPLENIYYRFAYRPTLPLATCIQGATCC